MRTLTAPGVEWKETDKSGYSPAMTGTACFIQGFTNKGEPYRYKEFTSRAAWTSYYGTPDNEAERYFYAAACECLNQGGRLYCARLPYDNEAFEKMVGIKYKVETGNGNVSSLIPEVQTVDSELKDAAVITASQNPITYPLSKIEEYRTDEAKVPAGTFLIVDTTGATYQKVIEDTRVGQRRELVGIVPVVTTAANAMYAQSLMSLSYNRISAIESINGHVLPTLKYEFDDGSKTLSNDGLCDLVDTVYKYNTQGYYGEVCCDFTTKSICTKDDSKLCVENLYDLKVGIEEFINDYKSLITFTYDLNTLGGIVDFYNNLKDTKDPVLSKTARVEEVVLSCKTYIDTVRSTNIIWYYVDDETGKPGEKVEGNMSDYIDMYDKYSQYPKFATGSYVNKYTIKDQFNDDGTIKNKVAVLEEATTKIASEWHAYSGDDAVPTTQSLDANNYFSTIQPAADGVGLDPEHLKDIGVVVYKMYMDASEGNKISYEAVEAYCGSLYKDDVDPNTGVTKFIDTIINSQSQYINFFSNCFSTKATKKWYKESCDMIYAQPTNVACLGLYSEMTKEDISIDKSIYDGMSKAFEKVTDLNLLDIDIVCDAGLANIASYLKAVFGNKGPYDLTITDDLGNSMLGLWTCKKATDPAVKTWKTVEQKFDVFCKKTRKDCMFIADGMRPLVLQGQKKIIRESKPNNTIDANILPYFPAICGLNTSYGAGYCDWFEMADDYTGDFFWCPPSIKAMGIYINTDVNYNYWDAPAGLNRGMVAATDVAFSPTPKQAGCFYEKNWNYAINYPSDGIVLEGQKTFQVKPSAFDRVNVRRLFCRIERQCYKVARYFVYEGNTAYTRQRLVDAIDPYLNEAMVGGGIYDYKIVCDESNNTATTIDNNELHVSVGIKPTKTVEYIIFNFIAGSTGASWEEIMG